jgi:hypothetical protein
LVTALGGDSSNSSLNTFLANLQSNLQNMTSMQGNFFNASA